MGCFNHVLVTSVAFLCAHNIESSRNAYNFWYCVAEPDSHAESGFVHETRLLVAHRYTSSNKLAWSPGSPAQTYCGNKVWFVLEVVLPDRLLNATVLCALYTEAKAVSETTTSLHLHDKITAGRKHVLAGKTIVLRNK